MEKVLFATCRYDCTLDAQEGVVTFLLEECAQQRVKENLLAYALLLRAGASRSRQLGERVCVHQIAVSC